MAHFSHLYSKLSIGLLALILLMSFNNCSFSGDEATQVVAVKSTTCSAPQGVSSAPKTIEQAVTLLNSLPQPVSVACFVQSLSRPLYFNATYSSASVQPAIGVENPRIFIFSGPLIMAIALEGTGKNLIEFSVVKTAGYSLKGELEFPIFSDLSLSAPYTRVASGGGSKCVGCHAGEFRDFSIGFTTAYISQVVAPFGAFNVTKSQIDSERLNCGNSMTSRCQILRAFVDHGPIIEVAFPSDIPNF